MSMMELATVVQEALPVKVILLNNECLGSIAHFAGDDLPALQQVVRLRNPDFSALAAAYGLPAECVDAADGPRLDAQLRWLLRQEGPALLEVKLGHGA
jgi:acetolactate synthase-1/2/3 large subunit